MRHESWSVLLIILAVAGCLGFGFRAKAQAQNRVVKVVAVSDTDEPLVIDARGDDVTFRQRHAKTVAITFSEPLTQQLSTNFSNFNVYAGTNFNTRINFTNVLYNFTTAPRIFLFMSDARWVHGSNYFVVMNNVADFKGNLIAPNTRVPVCWEVASGGLRCSPLPADPPFDQLVLSIKRQGAARVVSWPSRFGGYSLEYEIDFDSSLPWLTVSNQANPYVSTLGEGVRLFRLHKR